MSTTDHPFFFRICCFLLITTILISPLYITTVHAADSSIFINKCGQCHRKGSQATPVNPADKAGLVWIKYFKRQRHPVSLDTLVSEADLQNILIYLQDHAADSERPVAAAIPK